MLNGVSVKIISMLLLCIPGGATTQHKQWETIIVNGCKQRERTHQQMSIVSDSACAYTHTVAEF